MPDGERGLFSGHPVRLPPANIQAEQALLGAILSNNKAMDGAAILRPEYFADPAHGRIFAEARALIEAGRIADAVTLKAVFENAGALDEVGGTAYLVGLLAQMVTISHATDYARVIHDAWMRRQVIDISAEAADLAFGARTDVDGNETVSATIERLMALGEKSTGSRSAAIGDALTEAMDAAEAAARGEGPGGLMTGIAPLDELWGGLWPANLDCLGARSEHGKTALGMQIAVNVARGLLAEHEAAIAAGQRHELEHVEIYSLEMPKAHLAYRLLATETGIPARDIRAGKINTARAEALLTARAALRRLPIVINDTPSISITEIMMGARINRRRKRTRLVVIDHLHRIAPAEAKARAPRNEQVQGITEALKTLASSLGIPVLLLAQLSRQSERREDHRPLVSDIEYAGERDFDNIALLWRPELYFGEKPPAVSEKLGDEKRAEIEAAWWKRRDEVQGKAEVVLAKTRMGGVGSVWLNFDGPRTRFSAVDGYYDNVQAGMF